MASITRSDVDSRRQWQAFFDEQLRDIALRAPQPTADQSTAQYLRAVCRTLKYGHLPEGHELRGIPFDKNLPNDALYQLVPQVVDATKKAVNDPATVPYGEFRAIETVDPRTGFKQTRFIGQDNFVKFMGRPGRRVETFTTDRGKYDARKAKYVA
jgi:hypothetical protein